MALDDSEKKQVALKREAENKAGQCQDLLKQLSNMKEKHDVAFKKVLLKHVSYQCYHKLTFPPLEYLIITHCAFIHFQEKSYPVHLLAHY